MKETKKDIDLLILYAGLFFVSIITLPFILQCLLFMVNITTSSWLFPSVALIVFVICKINLLYFFNTKAVAIWSVLIVALLYSSYQLCINFYDFSYDGMWYQQDGVRLIAQGWNPFTHCLSLEETSSSDLYLNHYPKATWVSSGSIYTYTKRLESGKIINWFALFAALCFCYLALKSVFKLNRFTLILFTVLFALNPVVVYQLFTFYIDGLVGSLLSVLLCVPVLFYAQRISARIAIYCTIVLVSFIVNIKFTALIYVCIFALGSFVYVFLQQRKFWVKQTVVLGVIIILGVIVLGYPTYLRNTISHGHPFYPLMGKGNIGAEVAKVPMPANFFDKNRFEQFNLATFARAQWSRAPYESRAKALFSSDSFTILGEYNRADPEMSGFGPLFAEILLLVAVCLLVLIIINYKQFKRYYLLVIIVLTLSIIIIPSFWYARYVPQLWMLVLLLTIPFFEHPKLKLAGYVIALLALINCLIVAQQNMLFRSKQTDALNKQLNLFKQSKTPPIIYDGWVHSFKIKLIEKEVNYIFTNKKYLPDSITFIPNVEMSGAFFVNSSIQ